MTCKKCYHCDVCSEKDGTTNFYGKEFACNDVEKRCQYFKDKSRIVELPCKIGDKVYYLSIKRYIPLTHKMAEAEVLDYNINRYGICGVKIRPLNSDYIFEMSIDKIFLTKEEAEEKLKELNNEIH